MNNIKLRLIVMNFLEFAVWGAYLTSMGGYLATHGLADNIKQGCEAIKIALDNLNGVSKHPNVALEQCNKLHELEHAADDIYEQFITDVFVEYADDSVELIKLKEIMYELEKATDKAKNVGKAIKSIIVKYA